MSCINSETTGFRLDIQGFIKSHINGNNAHSISSSIQEMIHNSIDALATKIYLLHNIEGNFIIVDNGNGMNLEQIENLSILHHHTTLNSNSIGKYGVGVKDAIFCLQKQWKIFSKKKNIDQSYEAIFDIYKAQNMIKSGIPNKFISTGNISRTNEKTFIHLLQQLNLIKNDNIDYEKFQGTILLQNTLKDCEEYIIDEESQQHILENIHNLYNDIKMKIVNNYHYKLDIYFGNYTINEKLNIQMNAIDKIIPYDWLEWGNKINGKFLEFNMYIYLKKNGHYSYYINHLQDYIYKIKDRFDISKSFEKTNKIKIKWNIITQDLYNIQREKYNAIPYKNRLYGVLINRNQIDIYIKPNEYSITPFNHSDNWSNNINCFRCKIYFESNDTLDKIFGINTNKSLFLENLIHTQFKKCFNKIVCILLDSIRKIEYNDINLSFILSNILNNKSHIQITKKINNIKNKFIKIYKTYFYVKLYPIINNIKEKLYKIRMIQRYYKKYLLIKKLKYINKLSIPLYLSTYDKKKELNELTWCFSSIYRNYMNDTYIFATINKLYLIHNKIKIKKIFSQFLSLYKKYVMESRFSLVVSLVNNSYIYNYIKLYSLNSFPLSSKHNNKYNKYNKDTKILYKLLKLYQTKYNLFSTKLLFIKSFK